MAHAGADQFLIGCAGCFTPVILDGSQSTNPNPFGDGLQYVWREGATVLATTTDPVSMASVALGFGRHTIELTVTSAIVGSAGAVGPQGPAGATGEQASGSLLMMIEGARPPKGYVLVGTFVEERIDPDGPGDQPPSHMRIVIWRKR